MQKLTKQDLCRTSDPKALKFNSTAELQSLKKVIGQERAVKALEFGLEVLAPGYNVFVGGLPGTGKATIVRNLVEEYARQTPNPPDWIVVFNFHNEYEPKVFSLPAGEGTVFSKQMNRLVHSLSQELPRIFGGDQYQEQRKALVSSFNQRREQLIAHLNEESAKNNIQLAYTQMGFQTIPVRNKEPMTDEQFNALPETERAKISEDIERVQEKVREALREMAQLEHEKEDVIEDLQRQVALNAVEHRVEHLHERFAGHAGIIAHLKEVSEDIVTHVEDFLQDGEDEEQQTEEIPKKPFIRYEVNVLVDNSRSKGAPVIFDTNPSYNNVFGRIEKIVQYGALVTDFTMIQAGSLLRANGGFLILEIDAILQNPHVWESLKRALKNKQIQIEDVNDSFGMSSTTSMKPEPIPLGLNVVLLGRSEYFHFLQESDDAFNKTFKVRADFDYEVRRNLETEKLFCQFIARVCRENKLPHFTPEAATQIIMYSSRLAGDQNKLSLQFGTLVGIIMEAAYWAKKNRHRRVDKLDVRKAIDEKRFRGSLWEEKVWEQIERETLLIDVQGERIGQINGLAVYSMGEYSFGRPSRITATTFMGKPGIVSIEREAKLSGPTYNKGNLIVNGFLGNMFAQEFPLSVTINMTFEQQYNGIDGDSASSTELYAILSALSGYPIKQGIAVTGSVNQWGEVQAIGGVNEKVEGFFRLCEQRGLNGDQGVIIPDANRENLMLLPDVQKAVNDGKFNIWAVASIAQGIELLTGVAAGEPSKRGTYPRQTVFGSVQARLKEYMQKSRDLKQNKDADS